MDLVRLNTHTHTHPHTHITKAKQSKKNYDVIVTLLLSRQVRKFVPPPLRKPFIM